MNNITMTTFLPSIRSSMMMELKRLKTNLRIQLTLLTQIHTPQRVILIRLNLSHLLELR